VESIRLGGGRLATAAQRQWTLCDPAFKAILHSIRTTARQFNLYLSMVGQMVTLPRLLAFMAEEAPELV
jgi:hypothetical protein